MCCQRLQPKTPSYKPGEIAAAHVTWSVPLRSILPVNGRSRGGLFQLQNQRHEPSRTTYDCQACLREDFESSPENTMSIRPPPRVVGQIDLFPPAGLL